MTIEHQWTDRIIAYLHDPPDKALDIKGHVSRSHKYAELATGREISTLEAESGASKWADIRASEIERLPLPNAGENYHRAISLDNSKLTITHPLSGEQRDLACSSDQSSLILEEIRRLVMPLDSPQARFLALWRLLPEALSQKQPFFRHLPAETRVPDHTIWHHLDTASMLFSAYAKNEKLAFISLSLGPVQPFIAASRSLRDLWSSSMLLSWLSFSGMKPLLEKFGPTALVFPQLRGNPQMDLWLNQHFPDMNQDFFADTSMRKSPCLPNRFVALVPEVEAQELAEKSEQAIKRAWREVASAVHRRIHPFLKSLDPTWDRFWQQQVDCYFEIYTQILPWQEYSDDSLADLFGGSSFEQVFSDLGKIRQIEHTIPKADRPGYSQGSAGRWQVRIDLLGRLLESRKLIRSQPGYYPQGLTPPKCSLLGSFEQMGPAHLSESARFWENASQEKGWTRIRKGERFSAIALIKRYAAEAFLLDELDLLKSDLGFWDTATLAAIDWLKKAEIDPLKCREKHGVWSGQWLHSDAKGSQEDEPLPGEIKRQIQEARKSETAGMPPAYYSILMLDGDEMGKWLQGAKTPSLKQSYHPKIVNYFRKIQAEHLLEGPKSVTPALHASISEALANFALHVVPQIVEKHRGILIYAGGDDVLALLPTHTALACAKALNSAFRGEQPFNQGAPQGYYRVNNQDLLMMGPQATLSAGLAIVHYKEDLRLALNLARQAEKFAKTAGRNAIAMTAARRSGERPTVLALWEDLDWMQEWVGLFQPASAKGQRFSPLSNAWTYHLRETLPVMGKWSLPMMKSEIKRQLNRLENPERLKSWFESKNIAGEDVGSQMAEWFELYEQRFKTHLDKRQDKTPDDLQDFDTRLLDRFVLTCQTLAFLARGREE